MVTFYPVVTALALAHLVADYPLQTDWMASNKHDSTAALLTHSVVHGLVAASAVAPLAPLADVATVGATVPILHATTDAKDFGIREDQTVHLLSCILIAAVVVLW
jgi:hypothetical protein